jgi:hypothetical protein
MCWATADGICDDGQESPLPSGVRAVWDLDSASVETTATRERICINGLWRWQPAPRHPGKAPAGRWGFFKVPGCWPGITNYMQKDCQTVYPHTDWKSTRMADITAAWYQREVTIPRQWKGRRIALALEYLNSVAAVYLDDKHVGNLRFPGGELDLSSFVRPGTTHVLSMHVTTVPLKGVLISYSDTNAAREVQSRISRRGLCGDVYLVSTPSGPQIVDARVRTSVRRRKIAFDVAIRNLAKDTGYSIHVRVTANGHEVLKFVSKTFRAGDATNDRIEIQRHWIPEQLWDLHTPEHKLEFAVSLATDDGEVLDTSFTDRFGFREFWIDGRDFYLNGTRIFLSAVPLDNAQVGAAWASYDGARETLVRLKSFGINFVYTHNYGCQPGDHLSFAEVLRAADDVGMLVALSQPHFSHYDWPAEDADERNGYARHAEAYVGIAQNHPSVVAYSTSHNACGYGEDMNPDKIDGLRDYRTDSYALRNAGRALRAEAIIRRLDPSRIVYHHSSGNLGVMHTMNFYPNFVPIQEMSDWFGHWANEGVKPAFMVEYGAPFFWDWAMYRGWYKGKREFGSAKVPWEFCHAEWNSQFLGDRAFQLGIAEQENLRWEAKQLRAGKTWHRWDYPHVLGSNVFDERYEVVANYIRDNWRAYRTWGVSAISPWEYGKYWKTKDNVSRRRRELSVDWQHLQRPGFSPDYIDQRYERMDLAFQREDWIPTPAANALLRSNRPLLAYIAGDPAAFTSKAHSFFPAQSIEKQLVVINNSRATVTCDYEWSFAVAETAAGKGQVTVPTGQQTRVPIELRLPRTVAVGAYALRAMFKFSSGEIQNDSFTVHVVPRPEAVETEMKIAIWDPAGETKSMLDDMGVRCQAVAADVDLTPYDVLIVGKSALTTNGPAPDISRVCHGLRVIVFEQRADVLEQRLGFRVAEYGLRQVFPRIPDHPLLVGITTDHLRDWQGEATLSSPQLAYELRPRLGPTVTWCGIQVPRLWRCGNRGNVASVLIEKPQRGDFLPIVDGGYSLQYSPLLEHRVGQGLILFCQMDVTGRTQGDPAAETLVHRLIDYVAAWKPAVRRRAFYVGNAAGKEHLESVGVFARPYHAEKLSPETVLIVGPRGTAKLARDNSAIDRWLKSGGHLLSIGLDESEAKSLSLSGVHFGTAEYISTHFEPSRSQSLLVGVGPADVLNRDPRDLPLVTSGANAVGNGVLAVGKNTNVVFCQLVPWQYGGSQQANLRKTFRRSSFLLTRLLANMGVSGSTPIATRFGKPAGKQGTEKRWQDGLYLDLPVEWDDPYRFFRW